MNPRITPSSTTISNAVGCNLPAYIGTGTVESITDTRLVLSGGDFLAQVAGEIPYAFSGTTYIIIGTLGGLMTTEIIAVKSAPIIYGNYAESPPVPDSCTMIELRRPVSSPIAAGTSFYFCDPSRLDGFTSSLLKNMQTASATYTDPFGGTGTIIGGVFYEYDTSPDKGRVIGPLMVDATGTEVEITNTRA